MFGLSSAYTKAVRYSRKTMGFEVRLDLFLRVEKFTFFCFRPISATWYLADLGK